MKAGWTWKPRVVIAVAVSLLLSWLVWSVARSSAGDDAGPPALSAGKSPGRAAIAAAPPAPVVLGPGTLSELEDLRALALTHANAARTRAARMGEEAAVATAVALAGTDLEATEAWARSLEAPLRDAVFTALAIEVARTDPAVAIRLANQIEEEAPRRQMLAHALAQLAATDPRAAWDILQGMPDASDRNSAAGTVLAAVADHDPLAIAEWIAREDTPQELASSLAQPVVQRWTQQDPEAAAAWVVAFPEGSLRQQAAEALMQVWTSQDATAAAAWLDRAPPTARDEMAAALGSALAARDPETARSLASSITSATLRSRLLARLDFQTVTPPPLLSEQPGYAAGAGAACGCLTEAP